MEQETFMNKILRILCLEDCSSDAELVEYELKEAGLNFTALTVMKENEYVKALREFSPHIILSDYNLPQYDGTRALAEAKARCPAAPFILVTGEAGEDLAREMLAKGAQDCVMKDQLYRLVPAVQKALVEAGNSAIHRQLNEKAF